MFYDFPYMIFWKQQNYGDSNKINGCQGFVGERNEQMNHRNVQGRETIML